MGLTEEYTWGLQRNACGAYRGMHVGLTNECMWGLQRNARGAYLEYMCGSDSTWGLPVVPVEGNVCGT